MKDSTFRIRLRKDQIQQVADELNLSSQAEQVFVRRSRVIRSSLRLANKVKEGDKYALAMLKTYYKLLLVPSYSHNKITKPLVRTRFTNLIVYPYMAGKAVDVYNGKSYISVRLKENMSGRYLGEFIKTRTKGAHSAKGLSSDKIKR